MSAGKIFAIFFAATSPVLNMYYDGFIDQKWSLASVVMLAFLLHAIFTRREIHIVNREVAEAAALATSYLCLYSVAARVFAVLHPVGPFENANVLSLHLIILLPFIHHGTVCSGQKTHRLLYSAVEALAIVIIILSGCRTAWLCLIVFCSLAFLRGKWRIIVFPAILVSLAAATLHFKQHSTQGRQFILQNTIELIGEAPLTGHGPNGFGRMYMPHQADYFMHHTDPEMEMLADDIRHPLNEFLMAGVEYGVIGMAALGTLLAVPLAWKRKLIARNRALWMSLCMIVVFCMFGYPLLYPMTWIMIASAWVVTFHESICHWAEAYRAAMLPIVGMVFLALLGHTGLLLRWGYVSNMSKRGHSAQMMEAYRQLYPCLSWRSMFLYDYAIESLYAGRKQQAYALAKECNRLDVSYELTLLLGDICQHLGQHCEALAYYDHAGYMCPVRFAPLYGKWKVFKSQGKAEHTDSMTQIIRQKNIKVYSPEIQEILKKISEK